MPVKRNMKEALVNRAKTSFEQKDDTGRFAPYINYEEMKRSQFKVNEGSHMIDIIPYLAGKHDPQVKEGNATYVLDLWVHFNVGPNDDSYICMSRTYGKPCPICEYIRQQGRVDSETWERLSPKRRNLYNVICRDSAEEEAKGVQVFEVAHFFMEKNLTPIARMPKGGGFIPFADPEDGKSIVFEREGAGVKTRYTGHRFIDRETPVSDQDLAQAVSLDNFLVIPEYETLKALFEGGIGPATTEKELPDKDSEGRPDYMNENADDPQESTAPVPKEKPAAVPPAVVPRQPRGTAPTVTTNTCPVDGGTYGIDVDVLPECNTCPLYDGCSREYEKMRAERKQRRANVQ